MKLGPWPKRKKNAGVCIRGHARVPGNIYKDESNDRMVCRLCQAINQRNRRKQVKEEREKREQREQSEQSDSVRNRYRTGGGSGGDLEDEVQSKSGVK